jgi:hypothetical protein
MATITLDSYLSVAVAFAKQEKMKVLTNELFSKVNIFLGLKKNPCKLWKWQRAERLGRMVYKLPNIQPADLSTFETYIPPVDEEFDSNIISQLRTSLDVDYYEVLFTDGNRVKIDNEVSENVLYNLYELKPEQRLLAQEYCLASYDNLVKFANI